MAVKYDEVEILRGGIKYDRPSKGSFALNLLRRHGAWEVREGFGQLTQFDCRLTHNIAGGSAEWGYQKHLGSHIIQTDFGHEQIVSVFKARVSTSETLDYRTQIADIYVVSIYDTTTRERWEEPLYGHTSEGGSGIRGDLRFMRGQYESNQDIDLQSWVMATGEEPFLFTEIRDTVFFGSPATDLYAYSPATFRGNRRRQIAGAHLRQWAPPYSESSLVWPVKPSPGALPEVYGYRSDTPSPQALTSWDSRLVIAGNDREVYFSQKDLPTTYIDLDFIVVPTERKITALAAAGQSIYIFTDTETFLYQPSTRAEDPIASRGMEPVRISDSVGCVSQACVTKKDGAVIWLSHQGVHISSGGMDLQTISGDIDTLFTDFITDPMTSFFPSITAETGAATTTPHGTQRNSVITLNTNMAHISYSERLDALLFTLPEERVSFCYSGEQWSMWSYESNTRVPAVGADVGAVQNILAPWVLAKDKSLYVVGSEDSQALPDRALYSGDAGTPVDDDLTSRSAYILEYGRGGAIDRSVDDEDYRTVAGKYIVSLQSGSYMSYLVLGEWIPVEQQYKFNGTATGSTAPNGESAPSAPSRTVLVPVYVVPNATKFSYAAAANDIAKKIEIEFAFDNVNWRPIFTDASTSTNIDIIIPTERLGSAAAWTVRKCQLSGVDNRAGNTIKLTWDNGGAFINLNADRLNLLCYIPMRTITDVDVSGMGIAKSGSTDFCTLTDNASATYDSHAIWWREWRLASVRKEDSVAQPVDWAYMSEDVALPEDARVKARGMVVRLLSRNQGTDVTGGWSQGIFNTMMAADLKTWTAQVIDYIGSRTTFTKPVSIRTNLYPTVNQENTTRDRVMNTAGALKRSDFDNDIIYGNAATTTYEGNTCLVGNEQVDEVVTSDLVKGNSISTMLFGFMRNPAERLKLESVKMLYRVVSAARRRRGR